MPRAIDLSAQRMDYRVVVPADAGLPAEAWPRLLEKFLASEHWPHVRNHPKGDFEVDIRALVPPGGLVLADDGDGSGSPAVELRVSLVPREGGGSLPIFEFLAALGGEAFWEPKVCLVERTGYFGRTGTGQWRSPLQEVGELSRRFWFRKRIFA